jgi:predicted transcriptional regulator with HTH domain
MKKINRIILMMSLFKTMTKFFVKLGKPKEKVKETVMEDTINFEASIEGIASRKDGGNVLRLGLSGCEYANIAKLFAIKDNNKTLKISAEIIDPETYGENKT